MRTIVKSNVPRKVAYSTRIVNVIGNSIRPKIFGMSRVFKICNAKPGLSMDTSRFSYHKTPTPATDGAQLVFTLPDDESYVSGLLEVFVDGLLQIKDTDYTETSATTFTMTWAIPANSNLRLNYLKQ